MIFGRYRVIQNFKKIISDDIALQYRASLVFCRYSYVITHLNSADRVSEVSRGRAGKHDSGRGRHACVD